MTIDVCTSGAGRPERSTYVSPGGFGPGIVTGVRCICLLASGTKIVPVTTDRIVHDLKYMWYTYLRVVSFLVFDGAQELMHIALRGKARRNVRYADHVLFTLYWNRMYRNWVL